MILVYCPICHALVAGRGVDLEQARWAAADHQSEHDEMAADERDFNIEREYRLHLRPRPVEER